MTDGSGTTNFEPEGTAQAFSYNAIAYNPADNYIYANVTVGGGGYPAGALVRIGEGGIAERVGTQIFTFTAGRPGSNVGAFGDDGYYYAGTSDGTIVRVIDVTTGTQVRAFNLSAVAAASDWTFSGGFLWGVNTNGRLTRINPTTGGVTGNLGQIFPASTGSAGAAWTYANGNLGFSNNTSGEIAKIKITGPANPSPTVSIISRNPGPPSRNNDGTASPGAPVDLEIVKSTPATFVPGGQIRYELTVTNKGPGASDGYNVTDSLQAELTNVASPTEGCTVDGNDVTCVGGELAMGASATIVITATTASDQTACLNNIGQVAGNQVDPVDSNNSDEASACPAAPALKIEKSSDAVAGAKAGDTVTYTVKATNTSEVDFTTDNPAVVFDDLAKVLDDATYNNDASASQPGAVSFQSPLLSWTGPLGAGDLVELTYTVKLKAGGDGTVRNVTWVPNDPEDPKTPVCNPPEGGLDPATGEPCDETEFKLPRLSIDKAASQTELPAIGGTVDYTVTITNEGPGDYTAESPATFTDDLTNVLDSATFNNDTNASTGEASYNAPTLSWEGALAAGESATVTYSVTYTGEGDQNLRNLACVPEDQVVPGAQPCDFVQIPGADLTQWKDVQSTDDPTVAGSVLTYTLCFKNDGEAAADVDAIDDLTHVTDDADVTTEPTSADGLTVNRAGNRISITGQVPSGETYSVTYKVTVKADGERGDDIAANFLLQNDPENPPNPPEDPVCVPTDDQLPDCTSTPVTAITYGKQVEASSDPVGPGTVLTYTVTIENTGAATAQVSREDVLTDVLDDADLTRAPASDTDSVTVSAVSDGRFAMGGTLAKGATAKVTYQVTVKPESDRGNNSADNFLVPPGGTPPEGCVEDSPECTSTKLPNIKVSKTVDPESGTTVQAGQDVTYTLTFTNSGEKEGPANYTDNLAGVFDDADLTAGPDTSNPALTASLSTEQTLVITGTLAPDQTVTVTYTVTVGEDGERGDNVLGNILAPTGKEDPQCGDDGVPCTENKVPEIKDWKTVDPASGTTVKAGQVLTYTLHFENAGKAAGKLSRDDVLTGILDDAEVTKQPTASSGALKVSKITDGRFTISGSLEPGQKVTVTYEVTVKPDGKRGDDALGNSLVDPGTTPPSKCVPQDGQLPDCTVNYVSDVTVVKSSNPDSGTEVEPGQEVTYTLTFTNGSTNPEAKPAEIDYTDRMVDVLDDADLIAGPTVSNEALTAVAADGTIRVTGAIPSRQVYTVTYTVKVKAYDEQGNHQLGNVVAVTGGDPVCAPGSPLCTNHEVPPPPAPPVTPPGGNLAKTGAEVSAMVLGAALFLLLAGGGMLVAARRRHAAKPSAPDQDGPFDLT
ncbi:MAG: hypothetical protein L0G99_06375 [Propionibacteriales bacterium]|nr:hypothetical protein [Propionibacteriales bacterium]